MKNILVVLPAKGSKNQPNLFDAFISDLQYDTAYLCSEEKDKILKKDIDLDFNIFDDYKVICPVGAESLKYVCGLTGITKYNGVHIEKRYMPVLHPSLTVFKPQYIEEISKALQKLKEIADNDGQEVIKKLSNKTYLYVDTADTFTKKILPILRKATEIVVDIETTSLSPRKGNIIGVAFSTKEDEGYFVSSEVVKQFLKQLQQIFDKPSVKIIFHNAKFDIQWLIHEYGLEFNNGFEDTMLLHYCLQESVGTHGLKELALRYTDLGDYERELGTFKKSFCKQSKIKLEDFNYGMIPIDILSVYACKDGDGTMQIFHKFKPLVENNPNFADVYNNILIPATEALMLLEKNGGPIDKEFALELYEEYSIDIEECMEEIMRNPDVAKFEKIHQKTFNPNSTKQLQELFFDILQLQPIKKTEGGANSVDKEVMAILAEQHPLPEAILDLREKSKIRGTYIEGILRGVDKDGRLRSNFNIHGTTSGRLSSSGVINYQNLPRDNKDIKKLFKARKGYKIVQADLKTAEVYYAAVLSGDKFLQRAFIDKVDFHSYIAKNIFNLPCEVSQVKHLYPLQRQHAKAITFGIMYQAGPGTVAQSADVSFQEARKFINKYFGEARDLKIYIERQNDFISANQYIYSHFGRKRRLPESRSTNIGVSKHAIRSGVNFLIQSVASDINLLGLIDAIKWIKENNLLKDIIPFTVVHDSIVAEVREDLIEEWIQVLLRCMQTARGLEIDDCPIGVDFEVGPSWGELETFIIEKSSMEQKKVLEKVFLIDKAPNITRDKIMHV